MGASTLLDLLYPPACLLCQDRLEAWYPPFCPVCLDSFQPAQGAPVCFDVQGHPAAFETARAPWQYAGPMIQAVHDFKYRQQRRIGRWLSQTMAEQAENELPIDQVDAIVPVPTSWPKARWRGMSAPAFLARDLSKRWRKPLKTRLLRQRWFAVSQTRLSRSLRQRNAAASHRFGAGHARRLRILLIDDVLTTGSTANACARLLKEAGASRVFVLSAARTPAGAGR